MYSNEWDPCLPLCMCQPHFANPVFAGLFHRTSCQIMRCSLSCRSTKALRDMISRLESEGLLPPEAVQTWTEFMTEQEEKDWAGLAGACWFATSTTICA